MVFNEAGLTPSTCYTFRVAQYEHGMWSSFGAVRRVSTTAADSTDGEEAVAMAGALRSSILAAATSPPDRGACELATISHPSYVGGGVSGIEFVGQVRGTSGFLSCCHCT